MLIHEYLNQARSFERKHLPFVESLEDLDLLIIIGLHQERGDLVTMKQILACDIGSVATLERRLARLKQLGIVTQARAKLDKRNVELKLNAKTARVFKKYAGLVENSGQYANNQ